MPWDKPTGWFYAEDSDTAEWWNVDGTNGEPDLQELGEYVGDVGDTVTCHRIGKPAGAFTDVETRTYQAVACGHCEDGWTNTPMGEPITDQCPTCHQQRTYRLTASRDICEHCNGHAFKLKRTNP